MVPRILSIDAFKLCSNMVLYSERTIIPSTMTKFPHPEASTDPHTKASLPYSHHSTNLDPIGVGELPKRGSSVDFCPPLYIKDFCKGAHRVKWIFSPFHAWTTVLFVIPDLVCQRPTASGIKERRFYLTAPKSTGPNQSDEIRTNPTGADSSNPRKHAQTRSLIPIGISVPILVPVHVGRGCQLVLCIALTNIISCVLMI
nr:uncharacterized protein LOC123003034 [Drosophila takahashii]